MFENESVDLDLNVLRECAPRRLADILRVKTADQSKLLWVIPLVIEYGAIEALKPDLFKLFCRADRRMRALSDEGVNGFDSFRTQ